MTRARHRIIVAALAAAVSLSLAGCAGSGGVGWSAAGTQTQPAASSDAPPPAPVPVAQLLQPGQGVPIGLYEEGFPGTHKATVVYTLTDKTVKKVTVKLTYYEKTEKVKVPLDLSFGVGL